MQIEISLANIRTIHGDDYDFFRNRVISNCRCTQCDVGYSSTIVDYKMFLNELNDIIVDGYCSKCGTEICRYLETSLVEKYESRIAAVRGKYMKR